MAHSHEKLSIKRELRDPVVEARVGDLFRIVTQPRGMVEEAVRKYDEMVANFDRMEEVYASYNISKEELLKTIEAYRIMLVSSNDLC
jgi:hypothetical protein